MLVANWPRPLRQHQKASESLSDLHTQHQRQYLLSLATASKSPLPHVVQVSVTMCCSSSQVVIFQPPQLHTKMEDSQTVYEGGAKLSDLKTFIRTKL